MFLLTTVIYLYKYDSTCLYKDTTYLSFVYVIVIIATYMNVSLIICRQHQEHHGCRFLIHKTNTENWDVKEKKEKRKRHRRR